MVDAAARHCSPVATHIFSADATNRAVWMSSKIHGTEVESVYIFDPRRDVSIDAIEARRGFTDAQRVEDNTTRGTHNLIHKQLVLFGVPTWQTCVEADFEEDLDTESGVRSVRSFCYTSDGGPDEEKFKKLLLVITKEYLHLLVWPGSCFMHSCQLWVRSGLEIVDKWCKKNLPDSVRIRYFATLSKVAQVWRDKASEVYKQFSEQCGPVAAVQHARGMCPKAIAGRWQSSHAVELRMFNIGPRWFVPVMNAVLEPKIAANSRPAEVLPVAAGPGDELDPNTESAHEHRARMGRWRKDVSKTINQKVFWIILTIHNHVNEVNERFMNFLGSKLSESEVIDEGNHFFRLCSGKSAFYIDLFAGMLRAPGIFKLAEDPSIKPGSGDVVCDGLLSSLVSLAVLLTLHHAANFFRRVHEKVNDFPMKIVLFASAPPATPDETRQGALGAFDSAQHRSTHGLMDGETLRNQKTC